MHSKIFQLSPVPVPEDERMSAEDCYDSDLVSYNSDWVGDEITEPDERKDAIEGLSELLDGIADVDPDGKVTFRDTAAIASVFTNWYRQKLSDFLSEMDKGPARLPSPETTADKITQFRESKDIFRVDYLHNGNRLDGPFCTSAELVRDAACGYNPQVMYVGGIVDYHY